MFSARRRGASRTGPNAATAASGAGRNAVANPLWHRLATTTPAVQRQPDKAKAKDDDKKEEDEEEDTLAPVAEPLTEGEWRSVRYYLAEGYAGADPLTDDSDKNAVLIASWIAGLRGGVDHPVWGLLPPSEKHMARLIESVKSKGPLTQAELAAQWGRVDASARKAHVMGLLVNTYGYPRNAAAGIVGNLWAESGLLPPRVQGIFDDEHPLTGKNRAGKKVTFTARDLMENSVPGYKPDPDKVLPRLTGLGLGQWTTPERRAGLFEHEYKGMRGMINLFDMEAQVDYLVWELKNRFPRLDKALRDPKITVAAASEKFLRQFENPADIENQVGVRANLSQGALGTLQPAPATGRTGTDAGAGARGPGHDRDSDGQVHAEARVGISGPASALPHREAIQRSFGRHDVTAVRAHLGGRATTGAQAIGASAYTAGDHVAFADAAPGLHTAAHEAAHVVQQRAGVHLPGGVGRVGDPYERHADAVADLVVQGRSAEELLDGLAPAAHPTADSGEPVQRQDEKERERVEKLRRDYDAAVSAGDWHRAAVLLNGFSRADILARIARLPRGRVAAMHVYMREDPGVGPDSQGAQLTRPTYIDVNVRNELNKQQWNEAARFLNGFNDADLIGRIEALAADERQKLRQGTTSYNRVVQAIDTVNKRAASKAATPDGSAPQDKQSATAKGGWTPPSGTSYPLEAVDPRVLKAPKTYQGNPPPPDGWRYWPPKKRIKAAHKKLADLGPKKPPGTFIQIEVDGELIGMRSEWHSYTTLWDKDSGKPYNKPGLYLGGSLMVPAEPAK